LQSAHVGAGTESAAGPGEDDDAHARIGARLVHGVLEVQMHLVRPGIEPVRAVESDSADAINHVVEDRFICHPGVPSCAFLLVGTAGKTKPRYKRDPIATNGTRLGTAVCRPLS